MTQPAISVCPYLGLAGDPAAARVEPDLDHRCHAQIPPGSPDRPLQEARCLSAGYEACPLYLAAAAQGLPEPADGAPPDMAPPGARRGRGRGGRRPPVVRVLPWAVLAVLVLAVAVVYGRDLLRGGTPAASPAKASQTATATASPAPLPPTGTPLPAAPVAGAAAGPVTSTPEPGGRLLALAPKAGDAGWFGSSEARGNHLGDSYLYAGYFDGQALISAARIGLSSVPRGAPVREAVLQMAGLNDERFVADSGGTWSVQFLAAGAVKDYARVTFQELLNAPAAVTLVPTLFAADLAVGRTNTWVLDAAARAWLEQQLLDGADVVIARIVGPTGGRDTLFAWDSGGGPATMGEAPRLVLNLGAAPATPPALPTEAVIVATLTPTPVNVLTAVAHALIATDQAALGVTPLPYRIVTPTPVAENLATAQAYVAALGLPPLVVYTPTPGNAATADADAWLATAVAVTTGTFTPVPPNAVTPVILTPTPRPQNAATALAQALTATAQATRYGTPTPWAANVLLATATPQPVLPTAPPANAETAVVRAAEATLTAMARGAQTPVWPGDRVQPPAATPRPSTPTRAPAPPRTPTPTPTPTDTPVAWGGAGPTGRELRSVWVPAATRGNAGLQVCPIAVAAL